MATKKKRTIQREAQLARRKQQAKQRKLTTDLDRLFALGPGGSGQRPISLATPALLESTARTIPCPLCKGRLRVVDDEIDRSTPMLLRIAHCLCQDCGRPRKIWFRIQSPAAN